MGFKDKGRLTLALAFLLVASSLSAQTGSGQADSLVRLMKATSIELIGKDARNYRKAIDATFLHNGTYLICDTALWNVEEKVINCMGNVKLMQEDTELTSDKLDYLVDENLAQFRGNLVQLRNRKDNILRTRNLDYNTKDSIAVFRGGASMRDQDGQVIESDTGTYESARRFFTFSGNVNMFTDSVFVKTTNLTYDTDKNLAGFVSYIDFWKDGNMLSAGKGWYDHGEEVFFFNNDVHGLTKDQECWSDSLYFFRNTQNVKLLGNAQVQDTTRSIAGLANFIFYEDSLARVTMRDDAAVAITTRQNDQVDTLYIGSDDLTYWTQRMCDIPESEFSHAKRRLEEIMGDPVSEYRRKAAKAAAEAAARAKEEQAVLNGISKPKRPGQPESSESEESAPLPPRDTTVAAGSLALADSLAIPDSLSPPDSLSVADSLALNAPDTTRMGFLKAVGRVRMFRKDMQVACDSLRYCDLDSLARLFKDPIVWNDGNRQYRADSLFVLVRDGGLDRASLMSNAFIITQEDSVFFDQIKGTDVMAYFDKKSNLCRFDALGGAAALFYLKEDEVYATANKVESKMLSANLEGGELQRVYYFDSPKNDAYPIAQMKSEDHRMRGFNWQPEGRPESKDDVTPLEMRPSQRMAFESHPKAEFKQTELYFPGYMEGIYKLIDEAEKRREAAAAADTLDTPARMADTVAVSDSLATGVFTSAGDSLSVKDSLAVVAASDTAAVKSAPSTLDRRKERKELVEQARALRIARRDARWAELDARDAAKAGKKAQKKLDRKRARTRRILLIQQKQEAKDAAKLQEYMEKFEKQKDRKSSDDTEPIENPKIKKDAEQEAEQ